MSRLFLPSYDDLSTFGRDRGSGAALPSTDLRRGDVYNHTGLGCLMAYTGTPGWRQVDRAIVATDAARDAISTTYSALLHEGFEVWVSATDVVSTWTGAAWRANFTPWTTLPLVGGTVLAHDTPNPNCEYRIENGRVWLRGWAKSSGGAAPPSQAWTAIPAAFRPPVALSIWPVRSSNFTALRIDVDPAGTASIVAGTLAAGEFINLNPCNWSAP